MGGCYFFLTFYVALLIVIDFILLDFALNYSCSMFGF
jgi:hypothetical protein